MRRSPSSRSLLLLLLLAGAPPLAAQPYTRQIDAVPVRQAGGAPYGHPWLGGLNVPRPQFADIDGDGDPDLFVQDRSGQLMFFENTGTPQAHRFAWRTDAFAGLDVGEWARLADLDGDGDLDVLAETPFSYVRLYRNTGTPAAARFELAVDTLRATYVAHGGAVRDTLVFSDRQNLPALADIDCDGDPDLFLATLDGRLTFYENRGLDAAALPALRFVTNRYQGLEIIGDFTGKRARHGANAIALADADRDGDLDLVWGDFFSPSLYLIRNDGACEAPALALATDLFPTPDPLRTSGYNTPAFADLDADGDADLFAGVQGGAFPAGPFAPGNFYFFRNDGEAGFALVTPQFVSSLDAGQESTPAFADLDADGDLDLLVGNKIDPVDGQRANLFFFRNEGTPRMADFQLATEDVVDLGARFNTAPALADLDADGDPDLLVGGFDGTLSFFRNDGTPQQPAFVAAPPGAAGLPDVDVGQNSTPAFADLDADGDADLFVGNAAGTIRYFRNDGTPQQPAFVQQSETFAGLDAGARSAPAFHDADGNGTLDLFVGAERGGLILLRNTGTPQDAAFALPVPFDLPGTVPVLATPALADLDADGDAEVFVGGLPGGVFFYRNDRLGTAVAERPEAPGGALRLLPNHPNPFRAATTLRFRLAQAGRVRLAVYDVLGRAVALVLDAWLPPGEHQAPFDAAALPAGLYLYTLTGPEGARAAGTMLRLP